MNRSEIRILVVDDDEDDFFLLKKYLSEVPDRKFILHWASSYDMGQKELFEHKKEKKFDVCFIDYRLGIRTGIDFLKEAISEDMDLPLILLTGYGQREVDLEAMRIGAADYLVKDQISSFLLEKTVRYAIHRFESLKVLKDREAQILMQDRLASIGLLASSLAHEIGTPLGVIRGRAEYVSDLSGQDTVVVKSMNIIISEIDRISKLIHSLLNLARGDQAKHAGEIDLSRVFSDVLDLMGYELKKQGIEIKNEIADRLAFKIRGEAESLHQVILNLIVNSLHAIQSAMKDGRIVGHEIRLFVENREKEIAVCIEDTGCGISKQNLRNLFKPFFTTKDVGSGTGLGLATSYRIVEAWGGSIQVESTEGVGTVFKILLPLEEKVAEFH